MSVMTRNDMGVVHPAGDSAFEKDVAEIVAYVKARRGMGERQARRYVGRRITAVTLAWWRLYGVFPIGFRRRDARLYDDSGAQIKHAARQLRRIRNAGGAR